MQWFVVVPVAKHPGFSTLVTLCTWPIVPVLLIPTRLPATNWQTTCHPAMARDLLVVPAGGGGCCWDLVGHCSTSCNALGSPSTLSHHKELSGSKSQSRLRQRDPA